MSYGWLTESSLIPKPAKKINVDNSKAIFYARILVNFGGIASGFADSSAQGKKQAKNCQNL